MPPARPNFFVVGAPKCGTTSLYHWLAGHPDVFLPRVKEPHFFALLRHDRTIERLADYVALYRDAAGRTAVGDGSTTYLHTPGALEAVRAFAPDARIVVVVREPIDLVRSLHAYKLARRQEDVADFEAAWRLSAERRAGRRLPCPDHPTDVFQVVYADMGLLGQRIEHVYELFPAERVHAIVFDDLASDPAGTWAALLGFLGLAPDGRNRFDVRNATRDQDGPLVHAVARHLPGGLKRALRRVGVGSSRVLALRRGRGTPRAQPPLREAFLAELRDWYRPDVERLERRLGRDLSHWLGGRA